MNPERRAQPFAGAVAVENKAIRGYAAIYYDGTPATEYSVTGNVIERVHPGAFDEVLASQADMLALYNHEEAQLLGRRASGTLTLADESRGLSYSVPFDETDPVHQSVAARIRRRDVQGSSFTFVVDSSSGQSFERRSDGKIIRNLRKFRSVSDVGPTHLPSYRGTTAEFRSAGTLADLDRMAAEALGLEPPTPVEFYFKGQR
ncbi:MAG TPA: HK97 family phage prohead protease [Planctomycetaceae bacterium]|nr:HK97 family phage prohead protease [Planctomycetaceae bacterium]